MLICDEEDNCLRNNFAPLCLLDAERRARKKSTYSISKVKCKSMDYGRPMRKSSSLQGRKSTPTPNFLGTTEAYFVCLIGANFQISLDVRSPCVKGWDLRSISFFIEDRCTKSLFFSTVQVFLKNMKNYIFNISFQFDVLEICSRA